MTTFASLAKALFVALFIIPDIPTIAIAQMIANITVTASRSTNVNRLFFSV